MSAMALVGSALLVESPAGAQPEGAQGASDLEVYVGEVDAAGIEVLRDLGVDAQSLPAEAPGGAADVEVILSEGQAAKAEDAGVDLKVKTVDGLAASAALRLQAAAGFDVFRSYSEPGGIGGLSCSPRRASTATSSSRWSSARPSTARTSWS